MGCCSAWGRHGCRGGREPKPPGRRCYHAGMGQLRIPYPVGTDSFWTISGPWLKLALKYGVIKTPGWTPNASITFDRYCQNRGPLSHLPTVTDFAMTTLMNSRVTAMDLARAEDWLADGTNQTALATVAGPLARSAGLHDTDADTLHALGSVMDGITALPGIKIAKTAKWFSVWAPAHVPMLDRFVLEATTGEEDGYSRFGWAELLLRFQSLVRMNVEILRELAERLSVTVGLSAISPVRVLDGLLWIDWHTFTDFNDWFTRDETATGYALTPKGDAYERGDLAAAGLV